MSLKLRADETLDDWTSDGAMLNLSTDGIACRVPTDRASLLFALEMEPKGTAGAVGDIRRFLDEPFLVTSGDIVTTMDLGDAMRRHRASDALASIVLTEVEDTKMKIRFRFLIHKPQLLF